MKKFRYAIVAALLVGASSISMAQAPQGAPQGQGRPNAAAMLMQGITLSAEQQTKMDVVVKKYADERQSMMQDETMDRDARRAKMREMMGKQTDEMKAVLTDEQKKVFEKNQADMQARMQQGGQRPPQK